VRARRIVICFVLQLLRFMVCHIISLQWTTISLGSADDEPILRGLYTLENHKSRTYGFNSAFRCKMRSETLFLDSLAQNDVTLVQEKIQFARELATTLRRNVVQARITKTKDGQDAWGM